MRVKKLPLDDPTYQPNIVLFGQYADRNCTLDSAVDIGRPSSTLINFGYDQTRSNSVIPVKIECITFKLKSNKYFFFFF